MFYYSLNTMKELKKFRIPCVESRTELSAEELEGMAAEVSALDAFLKENSITWCRALILKGEGSTGDRVEQWSVARPVRVEAVYWMYDGDLVDMVFGEPLFMAGSGYTVRAAVTAAQPAPSLPAPDMVMPGQDRTVKAPAPAPVKKVSERPERTSHPSAVPGPRKKGTVFTGMPSTGIPSLDRVRGIKK